MTRAIPITVGNKDFRSRFFKKLLNKYCVGENVSGEDARNLHALLALHPSYDEKTLGQQIVGFDVNKRDHGTVCFYGQRADGTRFHFSYKRCLGLK